MKKDLIDRLKEGIYALLISGSTLYITGCNNDVPSYNLPETKITDKYADVKSDELAKQIDEELKSIEKYKEQVYNPASRDEWNDYVQKALTQIEKVNSLAIRSYIENNNYLAKYDKIDNKSKDWLNKRVHNLLYNYNKSFNKLLNKVDIDAFAQIVQKGDSLSIFEYNDDTHQLLEYRIKFQEGAKYEDYGGKFIIGDRDILLEVYEHNYGTILNKKKPQIEAIYFKTIDIYGSQTSLKKLLKE
ncbi:MAG: hypothetical protein KatS3mg002_0685 [Candidatus Woesearchaeota archaeon]|nr:MAG: hypothetical protein KatS3mg002_0685 [Candidatus Woesearchaeota archaeon]